MIRTILASASAAALIIMVATTPVSAQALKTAGACNDEYKAEKPAIKAAKELKRDFVAACRALPVGTPTPVGSSGAAAPAPTTSSAAPAGRAAPASGLKTAGACNDEYKANKGALKDAKEKKKDFIAACRALPSGSPTPIGTAAAPPPPAPASPAPAPAPAPAPQRTAPAPAPAATATSSRTSQAPAAPGESACGNGYAHLPASHTAAQFCDDAQAKARCPGQPVVWVNTKSRIFHVAGSNTYGHTKEGAYMCETDATAEGDRASKNGH